MSILSASHSLDLYRPGGAFALAAAGTAAFVLIRDPADVIRLDTLYRVY